MTRERRFETEFRLRVPAIFPAALDRAARQSHKTKSEYVRQAVLASLKADGIDTSTAMAGGLVVQGLDSAR